MTPADSLNHAEEIINRTQLSAIVIGWHQQHGRHNLPWQLQQDPYHVLVSEIMLQQTQVATVIPYFERWLSKLPKVSDLADASEDEVMALWQGLGYYSRARNLHRAAREVCASYNGKIPDTPAELRAIPGIGPYTAGAITAFAFDKPAAIVDGNVARLFCRLFGIAEPLTAAATKNLLWALADYYTPESDNRIYAQGLLDLGATVCKPRTPDCQICPLQPQCVAYQTNRTTDLPLKKPRATLPNREADFLLSITDRGILLEQRPAKGIWPRLYCLPEIIGNPANSAMLHGEFKHTFSHYKLLARVWSVSDIETGSDYPTVDSRRIALEELVNYGLPAPIAAYLQTCLPTHLQNAGNET
ncbi:A/G-specific adenine glycosylase [Pseudidiomarina sp.]|uniref:A/G-specific adenine glycosylase n=1 Tax=Pseudidiomarina sp. TaxID=2081707 RepID=UPI00299F3D0D|nr:A/G-specific adenine glycosylase [Pseudidiomarina sp.]MDX1705959.1 A/G-specific adenine glycosylase [Pseudidiomarina sp.]